MLTITKPIIGLLLMAAAAFGEPASTACGSTLFDNYTDANFTVESKADARSLLASVKGKFKAIKVDYRAAKQNLRKLGRGAKDGATEEVASPTEPPTPPPTTEEPTPGPTILELTYDAGDGNFEITAEDNCTAKIEELQKYTYIAGNLHFYENQCPSVELSLLKGIGGNLIVDSHTDAMYSFNAEQLQTVGGFVDVQLNFDLVTFNADKLQTIGGYLIVAINPGLETLGLAALNQTGTIGGQFLRMYANTASVCSQVWNRLQSVCTGSTSDQGDACYVDTDWGTCD